MKTKKRRLQFDKEDLLKGFLKVFLERGYIEEWIGRVCATFYEILDDIEEGNK